MWFLNQGTAPVGVPTRWMHPASMRPSNYGKRPSVAATAKTKWWKYIGQEAGK